MVMVARELRSRAARFDVGVQAESIQRAMNFVRKRYPKGTVRLKFPIEAESFFVEDPIARTGIVGPEPPTGMAA